MTKLKKTNVTHQNKSLNCSSLLRHVLPLIEVSAAVCVSTSCCNRDNWGLGSNPEQWSCYWHTKIMYYCVGKDLWSSVSFLHASTVKSIFYYKWSKSVGWKTEDAGQMYVEEAQSKLLKWLKLEHQMQTRSFLFFPLGVARIWQREVKVCVSVCLVWLVCVGWIWPCDFIIILTHHHFIIIRYASHFTPSLKTKLLK